jgi:hypothetical protein
MIKPGYDLAGNEVFQLLEIHDESRGKQTFIVGMSCYGDMQLIGVSVKIAARAGMGEYGVRRFEAKYFCNLQH